MTATPRRSIQYSQNFLKSRYLVDELLDKCDISLTDTIYEIGPGKGVPSKVSSHPFNSNYSVTTWTRILT